MTDRFDAIVVGGGAMGTAAARNLALRGRGALVLERFTFGHGNGSSGGPTRIFRYVYHTPEYVELAMRAREPWDELEDAAGEPLFRVTGGLDLGDEARVRGALLAEAGVAAHWLDPGEVRERWPALHLSEGEPVLFQPDGGVLRAERTVEIQAQLAAEAGATLMTETVVTGIDPTADGAEVTTATGDRFAADVVVVSAGSWAGGLLATAGIDLPLQPSLEQSTYFDGVVGLPTVIDWGADPAQPPYLVPDPFDPGGFKAGLHHSGPMIDADSRSFDADAERVQRVFGYVDAHVRGARATGRTDTCLYTLTPDEDFVLDRVGPLVVVSPCSGHGFKFVPLFGRIVADLATGTDPDVSLRPFRLDRPRLAVV